MQSVSRHLGRLLLHMTQVGTGQGRYLLAYNQTQQRRSPLKERVDDWPSPANPENPEAQSSKAQKGTNVFGKRKKTGIVQQIQFQDYQNSINSLHTKQPSFTSILSFHLVKQHAHQSKSIVAKRCYKGDLLKIWTIINKYERGKANYVAQWPRNSLFTLHRHLELWFHNCSHRENKKWIFPCRAVVSPVARPQYSSQEAHSSTKNTTTKISQQGLHQF